MGPRLLSAPRPATTLPHARAIAPRGNRRRPNYHFRVPPGAPDTGGDPSRCLPMLPHVPRAERDPSSPRAAARLPRGRALALAFAALLPLPAHASFLHGDALDALANGVAWAALVIVPLAAIAVFWIVHILPEKIAEKRRHPQLAAIKTLCLLSLLFGGMLWPFAWLWAYTKPVLHKMAYGTDVDDHDTGEALSPVADARGEAHADDPAVLRERIAALEAELAARRGPGGGAG